jgi:diaminopimelate epimerase
MTRFWKGHGLGNDYLVVDGRAGDVPITPAAFRLLCDRHRGVGSDGVLVQVATARADFGLRIFNPDGSEAEKSGNGLRIFARWLVEERSAPPTFTIDTAGGVVACACRLTDGVVTSVAVEMGRASFRAADVGLLGVDGDAVRVPLDVGDERLTVTTVSVGNPHCVVFVPVPDDARLARLGPAIEGHARFPARTNVQLAAARTRSEVDVRIWERGAGATLASGSSSCAVAAAAVREGRCDPGRIVVHMPGGVLSVEVRPDWSLRLDGPVAMVCSGVLSVELERALNG